MPRLFHFSEDSSIRSFAPRPVVVPSRRRPGRDWLNGPLVWAIDEDHSFLYFFPRDCPRLLCWRVPGSRPEDVDAWLGGARVVAHVEAEWLDRLRTASLARYELAADGFEDLQDAGMWVSRQPARILSQDMLTDLPGALADAGVVLRIVDSLAPLSPLLSSSLHVSAIRLRNSRTWQS